MRASYLRMLLSACDEFGPPAAEIRARLGDVLQTRIECAGPLVWLPIDADLALQHALDEVLGRERTREFVLATLREFLAASILQTAVSTAVGLFGLNPGSFARLLPRAWGLLYRDCGQWSVSRGFEPDRQRAREWREVELGLSGLPHALHHEQLERGAWLSAVSTVLHALLILCEREGEVELLERDERAAKVVFRLAWKK